MKALSLLETVREKELGPDDAMHALAIRACGKKGRWSEISRIRFIHFSNRIPCSSNVFLLCCLAILRIEGCLNSTL